MLIGRIEKQEGKWWSAEVPLAGVFTQGTSFADAKEMLADAFKELGLPVRVVSFGDYEVLVMPDDPVAMVAHILRYHREASGFSLADMARKLGASSRNSYARYEKGDVAPTIDKFMELLHAVAPDITLILADRDSSGAGRKSKRARP